MSSKQKQTIMETQGWLLKLGYDPKGIDGIWGKDSAAAYAALLAGNLDNRTAYGVRVVPWARKLTEDEVAKMAKVVSNLGWPKSRLSELMACIAWESGETFSPSVANPRSSARGLIQFMASTAKALGTTSDALVRMSVIEQLDYVEAYFRPYAKRIKNLGDLYMGILWPKAIGLSDTSIVWSKKSDPKIYDVNSGLDINQDGTILRIECLHKIINKQVKGHLPAYGRGF